MGEDLELPGPGPGCRLAYGSLRHRPRCHGTSDTPAGLGATCLPAETGCARGRLAPPEKALAPRMAPPMTPCSRDPNRWWEEHHRRARAHGVLVTTATPEPQLRRSTTRTTPITPTEDTAPHLQGQRADAHNCRAWCARQLSSGWSYILEVVDDERRTFNVSQRTMKRRISEAQGEDA